MVDFEEHRVLELTPWMVVELCNAATTAVIGLTIKKDGNSVNVRTRKEQGSLPITRSKPLGAVQHLLKHITSFPM